MNSHTNIDRAGTFPFGSSRVYENSNKQIVPLLHGNNGYPYESRTVIETSFTETGYSSQPNDAILAEMYPSWTSRDGSVMTLQGM
jgi:hypothetical protein